MKNNVSNGNLIVCALTVLIFGFLDYRTGWEIKLGFLYLLPIIAATFSGQRGGTYAIAILCTAVMSLVDRYSGLSYTHTWHYFWNMAARLVSFLIVAWLAGFIPRARSNPPAQPEGGKLVTDEFTALLVPYENRLSFANKAGRFLWAVASNLCFHPTPGFLHAWRVFLLRCFGARIGRRCRIAPSCAVWAPWHLVLGDDCRIHARVDCYTVDRIEIGNGVTIGTAAYLCTASHDIADPRLPLTHAPIRIESNAWIGDKAFLFPGIRIGEGGLVGACAVVTHDVAPWTIVGGNPAQVTGRRTQPAERAPGT